MTAKRCKCGEIPEIEASRFEHIGKDQGEMEQITRPNLPTGRMHGGESKRIKWHFVHCC